MSISFLAIISGTYTHAKFSNNVSRKMKSNLIKLHSIGMHCLKILSENVAALKIFGKQINLISFFGAGIWAGHLCKLSKSLNKLYNTLWEYVFKNYHKLFRFYFLFSIKHKLSQHVLEFSITRIGIPTQAQKNFRIGNCKIA